MKLKFPNSLATAVLLAFVTLHSPLSTAFGQGTAFTCQIQLSANGGPANGNYDFTFGLYNTNNTNSGQAGSTLTNLNAGVSNGLCSVVLDFGPNFPGANRWLAIAVRTNGSENFTALNPLQQITPAPYAITAMTATSLSGALSNANLGGTYTNALTFSNGNNSFTGNGGGLTNLNLNGAYAKTVALTNTANTFAGNGGGLTNLSVSGSQVISIANPATGYNFFVGPTAGNLQVSGNQNTGIGYQALNVDTTGGYNTAVGAEALMANGSGAGNTALGSGALSANTTGQENTAVGESSLYQNNGSFNTALGWNALGSSGADSGLVAIGYAALQSDSALGQKNAIGQRTPSGYGENTAIGYQSLNANNIGVQNTAVGFAALSTNLGGGDNTAIGAYALSANTSAGGNTAAGNAALWQNTTGSNNTASGNLALQYNQTGNYNTANGAQALGNVTTDGGLVGIGYQALQNDNGLGIGGPSGYGEDTAVGYQALAANTTGTRNTALGFAALSTNTGGYFNVAVGSYALSANLITRFNTAVGHAALQFNTSERNTATGYNALWTNTTGSDNTALGSSALGANTSGSDNTAFGSGALSQIQTGANNVAVGYQAGVSLTLANSGNIDIANAGNAGDNNTIRIGTQGSQTTTAIAGISGGNLPGTGQPVYVDSNGHLGTTAASFNNGQSYTPTIGDAQGNQIPTTTKTGYYTKVGNLIYFEINIVWTAISGVVTADAMQISLPVAPVANVSFAPGFYYGFNFNSGYTQLIILAGPAGGSYPPGGSYLFLYSDGSGDSDPAPVILNQCYAQGAIRVSGVYRWQ